MADITRDFDFSALPAGSKIKGADVDSELDKLFATINNLDDANFAASSGMYSAYKLIAEATVPVQSSDAASTVHLPSHTGNAAAHGAAINAGRSAVLFRFKAADHTIPGRVTKLRLVAELVTANIAPGITITAAMYPLNNPVGGNWQFLGAVAGSSVPFASPAANLLNEADSGDFTPPADGRYGLGFAKSAVGAGGFDASLNLQLQAHYI